MRLTSSFYYCHFSVFHASVHFACDCRVEQNEISSLHFDNIDNFDEDVIYDRKYTRKFEDDTFAFETFTIDEKIYKDLSKRTSQREADLIKTVIVKTFEI